MAYNISKEYFLSLYKTQTNFIAGETARAKALMYIQSNDFPTSKTEEWRHTILKNLLQPEYQLANQNNSIETISDFLISELKSNVLVLVNGILNKKHNQWFEKSDKIIVESLQSAKQNNSDIFEKYFDATNKFESIFDALNSAFASDGLFIKIPKNTILENPIHIVNIISANHKSQFIQPRNLFVIEENAQAIFLESFHFVGQSKESQFQNQISEVILRGNSRLAYYQLFSSPVNCQFINALKVEQENSSVFNTNSVLLGGGLVRNEIKVNLNGQGCETNLNGIYLPNANQFFDNYTSVIHAQPHCASHQVYKGIIGANGSGNYLGKVYVAKDAQKTDATQSNKNILLDATSQANSKPQLEIHADDVKCSHGSTTGQLDKEQLFYLQSRGITKIKAQNLLLNAFTNEVTGKIEIEGYKNFVEELIQNKLQ